MHSPKARGRLLLSAPGGGWAFGGARPSPPPWRMYLSCTTFTHPKLSHTCEPKRPHWL